MTVDQTGWFVARAFEKPTETERFAHTSPVYIRVGNDRGIVPEDAQYFVKLMSREMKFYQNLSAFRTATDRDALVNMFEKARAAYARLAGPDIH
jgi:hypothetical protein